MSDWRHTDLMQTPTTLWFLVAAFAAACTVTKTNEPATLPPIQDVTWQYTAPDGQAPETTAPPDATDDSSVDAAPADVTTADSVLDGGSSASDTAPDGVDSGDTVSSTWSVPACSTITGTPAITFTTDQGTTLAATELSFTDPIITGGVVTTDVDDLMLATVGAEVIASPDAGCTWSSLLTEPLGTKAIYRLSEGVDGAAWAWTPDAAEVHLIDGVGATASSVSPTTIGAVLGFAANQTNGDRAQLLDQTGRVYITTNAGGDWISVSASPLPPMGSSPLTGAFHPTVTNTVFVGFSEDGFMYSEDGGKLWASSSGLSVLGGGKVAGHAIAFSPDDPDLVWVMAVDADQSTQESLGRHIYRSSNGGKTFAIAFSHSATTVLNQSMLLAPHPTDSNVLHTVFGTGFFLAGFGANQYGTDVYTYTHLDKGLAKQHHDFEVINGVGSIAFNPGDPSVMYLGMIFFDPNL